jgi:hypothetical protein
MPRRHGSAPGALPQGRSVMSAVRAMTRKPALNQKHNAVAPFTNAVAPFVKGEGDKAGDEAGLAEWRERRGAMNAESQPAVADTPPPPQLDPRKTDAAGCSELQPGAQPERAPRRTTESQPAQEETRPAVPTSPPAEPQAPATPSNAKSSTSMSDLLGRVSLRRSVIMPQVRCLAHLRDAKSQPEPPSPFPSVQPLVIPALNRH